MRILCVADKITPELLKGESSPVNVDSIDLILSCGDLPPEYLISLKHVYDVPLLYILGNHDLRFANTPVAGCENIDQRLTLVNGLRILGFSGSRWYNGGKNQYTEKEMRWITNKVRLSVWRKGAPDIIISHAPPRGIGDEEDPCHRGFRSFVSLISRYSPAYFIHGHIHRLFTTDEDRVTTVNETKVINSYGYYVFEI